MNILGINVGHNSSVALLVNGKIEYYCEEERVSRVKYDGNPFRAMVNVLNSVPIDHLVICGTERSLPTLPWTGENPYQALARKYNPNIQVHNYCDRHHLTHAATAFYNSGFETAASVVVDGAGSYIQNEQAAGYETESIYHCSYPSDFNALYKRYSDGSYNYYKNDIQEFDGGVTIVKAYEAITHFLGFGFIEAGKTMGLAPYGISNDRGFFVGNSADRNLFAPSFPAGAVFRSGRPDDGDLNHEFYKNIAAQIQSDTQKLVGDLIQKAVDMTGETNVVISGGYALNVMANRYFLERFPELNIYVEPISNDGGCSIGGAKLVYHELTSSSDIQPLESLYLGNRDNYSMLDAFIEQTGWEKTEVSPSDVAKLIKEGNIVTLFQGAAEAGPRALGNRSILFDPTDPDGKDKVNLVKGREWFRPFAASVLEEDAAEWFNMETKKESSSMMYAFKGKTDKLPAVTHVDGTCRIQTVTRDQNTAFYELISAFKEITGVPVLFNTSFNLAGQPLVDTLQDAFNTVYVADINYLWLPDVGVLITKKAKE